MASDRFIKGIWRGAFPAEMSLDQCFREAKAAGFGAIELQMTGELAPGATPQELKRVGEQAKSAEIEVASLWVSPLAQNPLNSEDPQVRARGVDALKKAVEFAGYLNCSALLVVPGSVGVRGGQMIGYETTWRRLTDELAKALPTAERGKVVLAVENVSNRFLLSPLEMRAFVDQFRSPWLRAYFDIGNVMYTGYPQDWILTLGSRIVRVHAKDRKSTARAEMERPSALLEGDVDWKAVMEALVKVGYRGFISLEIGPKPGDPDHVRKLSAAFDRILEMAV
jgi:L-ribulose-5-phosphate 3-epimerase